MAEAEEKPKAAAKKPSGPKGPLILALVNTLSIVAALGILAYSKLIYQRPKLTEETEKERMLAALKQAAQKTVSGNVDFEKVVVNIETSPEQDRIDQNAAQAIRPQKTHTAQIAFSLEIKNIERKDEIDLIKAIFLDEILTLIAKKGYADLVTVQGRYLLRSQIMELANDLIYREITRKKDIQNPGFRENLVTNVYFTNFTVQ